VSDEPTPDTGAASVDLAVSRRPGVEARNGKFGGPSLIPDLEEIKARHGFLPRDELVALAHRTRRPLYEIQGLISFYPHFRTDPPVKVDLHVCHDLACWMAGYEGRLAELRARYGDDVDVEIREVSCLGRCDAAPAVWVNEHTTRADGAETLVEQARGDTLPALRYPRMQREWPNDPYAGAARDYAVARRLLDGSIDPDAAIATLKDAGLRGMGGAGFPTGLKWGVVRAEAGAEKYAICNADESEPGTFKDSQILADQPHLVLEGLLIGMLVVGADRGYVYIRHEYVPEADALRAEIERMRALGLLDATRTIEIFVSPGGYILGEETALLEAMEGHRGEPRNKPPFPGQHGLWGRPTLINSVETLADVPIILERGAEWWTAQGVNGSTGLKFFAVSGDVEEPAVYCVPMGTTVGDLIALAGGVSEGRALGAVQPGGASSNFVGPEILDTPLDFKTLGDAGTMLGSGAVVVCAEGTDLLAAATNVLRFFRNESCGKCVPCRVGSQKAHTILIDHLAGGGTARNVPPRILELEETMRMSSICGLGQVALGPVASVLRMAGRNIPEGAEGSDGATGANGTPTIE
jgi:NADH:ubiquinone oxidoreductase subunit F (NADH-binding)/NADH:ubiquinone oxidoreductase subunit E